MGEQSHRGSRPVDECHRKCGDGAPPGWERMQLVGFGWQCAKWIAHLPVQARLTTLASNYHSFLLFPCRIALAVQYSACCDLVDGEAGRSLAVASDCTCLFGSRLLD